MRNSPSVRYGAPLVVAVTILTAMLAAPSAQRRGRGGDPNPGTPVATNTIADNPDAYYGKPVTMSAGVEQILSKTAFLIDQRKVVGGKDVVAIGKPLLVIAPYLTGTLDSKNYMLLRGDIVKLDPTTIARLAADYKIDLAPEVAAKYQGRPVLLATAVINSAYVDLARKPLAPMTADEIALDSVMKRIGPAFAALRTATEESKTDVVTQNAAALKQAFTEAETIWDDIGQSPAAQWARDARGHVQSIERNVAGGNWDGVKTSAGALNQVCQACHGAYRDRLEDGTFRVRPGSF